MASFFSYWHCVIGSKWGPPRLLFNRSLLEYVKSGALEFVLIVSPLFELRIIRHFFFWIPYSTRRFFFKKFIIFVNHLTNRFDWFVGAVRIQHYFLGDFCKHSSLFRSYLPHPNLELCTIFFCLLILQGTFYQNFKNFLNRVDWLASDSTGSSGQLVWRADFFDFGA